MGEFLPAYKKTGGFEGGYVNDPTDRGGETYCGISRKFHPSWEGWLKLKSFMPMKKGQIIHDSEIEGLVKSFYKREFWDRIKGDQIDDQEFAEKLYDRAVNFGVKEAIRQTQKALNMEETGSFSDELLTAINNPDQYLLS